MRLLTLPVCATALALAIAPQAMARDYGQHGAVWPVIEPDLLQQIHARLTQLEKTGETARLNEELKRRTIARVNRVWKDKPHGLIVDYLGLVENLREALAIYTQQRGAGSRTSVLDLDAAVDLLRQYYEVCCDLFHGFDWSRWSTGTPGERLTLFPAALEHILAQQEGRKRLLQAVGLLSRAYAIASSRAMFSGVCPPNWTITPSGRSFS